MKRLIAILIVCVMATSSLAACSIFKTGEPTPQTNKPIPQAPETSEPNEPDHGGSGEPEEYAIAYDLGSVDSNFIKQAPTSAKADETVTIITDMLIDADIHIYVDGQEIGKTYYESDRWEYSFIMPDKNVTITARPYTKNEIWGSDENIEVLKSEYPEYFDVPTAKGLEIYVWQMSHSSYSFGILPGTNREKTLEELMNLKGVSLKALRVILSTYDIEQDDVIIIPWQNPLSSYIPEIWLKDNAEPDSVYQARRNEYIKNIRDQIFERNVNILDHHVWHLIRVSWKDWDELDLSKCLNPSSHLPTWKANSVEEYEQICTLFSLPGVVRGFSGEAAEHSTLEKYTEEFFKMNVLTFTYISSSSGSIGYGLKSVEFKDGTVYIHPTITNDPDVGTCDMAGWLLLVEIPRTELEENNITNYDACMY